VGRATKATPETIEAVERGLAIGATIATVAKAAAVSPRTIDSWLRAGVVVRPRLASVPDLELDPESDEPLNDEDVEAAMASTVIRAAQEGDWRAARFV
jgi:hypothetical protein